MLRCRQADKDLPYRIPVITNIATGTKIGGRSIALTKFTTGDIPDIYMHFGNSNLLNFNVEENFYDFSDAEWVEDIQDSVLPQTKVDGKVYGLPFWEASISGCFYNKQIFEEQGIEIPTTQEEFNAACDTLVEAGIQPIYMAVSDAWPVLYQYALDPVFDSEEGEVLLEQLNNNEITYADIPEVTDMLNWFKMAAERGWLGESFMTDTWDYSSEVLGTGEAAMMFGWDTWFDTDYDSESYDYTSDDFGIMPVFWGTADEGTYEGPNVELTMVNKNSENVEEALDFVNFMAQPENYNVAFDGVSTYPVFKSQTTNIISSQAEEAADSIDTLARASVAQPRIIGYSQSEGGKAIQELIGGNITVEECIKLMDDDRIATLQSFLQE
ncbi:MAG: ABC transporter substrate-binding protein [Lachnospiraceae bacterium]